MAAFARRGLACLQSEHATIQNRLDAMYVDKLDGRIENAFFDRMSAAWRADLDRIAESMGEHRNANRGYIDEGVRLLELGGRAAELFKD